MENIEMKKVTISVIIAAKNEGHQIEECINSVSFADEVLVLDSGSTDETAAKAKEAGATVHITDWPGYGNQQRRGIGLAKTDWVLSLDADERVSAALKDEILLAIASDKADGYRLPRYSSFCGKFISASGWQPDYTLRLVRKELAGFTDHFLHAHMTAEGKVADLQSPIIHYSYRDLDDVLEKMNRYSRGAALDMEHHTKELSLSRVFLSASWAFFRTYVIKRGFMDGKFGLILAIYNAEVTYYKYLRLWMKMNSKNIKQNHESIMKS